MKKFILTLLLVFLVAFPSFAQQYVSDIIMTGTGGIWTDERSYSTLADALTALGSSHQTLLISEEVPCTTATINANTKLKFVKTGAIANTGQLTINTRDIIAEDRQIFTGTGDIDFYQGSEVRSAWFSDVVEAFDQTNDDEITLVISKPGFITANCAVGDDVSLKWEAPRNQLTANAGFTLSNIKNIEAGNYQLFAGAGDFDFVDGVRLKLDWFNRLRSVLFWVETEDVTIEVTDETSVDYNCSSTSNESFEFTSGGWLNVAAGVTVTLDSPIDAGRHQIFGGSGTVDLGTLTHLDHVYPEWWGVVVDDVTAAITNIDLFNECIAAAEGTGVPILLPPRTIYIGEYGRAGTIHLVYTDDLVVLGSSQDESIIYADPTPDDNVTVFYCADSSKKLTLKEMTFACHSSTTYIGSQVVNSDGSLYAERVKTTGNWGKTFQMSSDDGVANDTKIEIVKCDITAYSSFMRGFNSNATHGTKSIHVIDSYIHDIGQAVSPLPTEENMYITPNVNLKIDGCIFENIYQAYNIHYWSTGITGREAEIEYYIIKNTEFINCLGTQILTSWSMMKNCEISECHIDTDMALADSLGLDTRGIQIAGNATVSDCYITADDPINFNYIASGEEFIAKIDNCHIVNGNNQIEFPSDHEGGGKIYITDNIFEDAVTRAIYGSGANDAAVTVEYFISDNYIDGGASGGIDISQNVGSGDYRVYVNNNKLPDSSISFDGSRVTFVECNDNILLSASDGQIGANSIAANVLHGSGNRMHRTGTWSCTNEQRLSPRRGTDPTPIASAGTITIPMDYDTFHITGTTQINFMNPQSGKHYSGTIYLIFDSTAATGNGGNIYPVDTGAHTANIAYAYTYDPAADKWHEVAR